MRPLFGALLAWMTIAAACGDESDSHPPPWGYPLPDAGLFPPRDAAPRDAASEPLPELPIDPGYVGARLLSNTEYDLTVRDLLGVTSTPVANFPRDVTFWGFDNPAIDLSYAEGLPRHQIDAAWTLGRQVFADPDLRARIVTCTPDASPESRSACAADVIRTFGHRAFRRPLSQAEVDELVAVATADRAEDFLSVMQRVVIQILSSPRFGFRREVDPDPMSTVPHPVTPYELASRLSYLVWSTMPDQALFDLAESGDLAKSEVLLGSLRRLLADERSDRFMRNFAGQWMSINELSAHQANVVVFPPWNDALAQSMTNEAYLYLQEFMRARPFSEFLTADFNFVDGPLAGIYGFPAPNPADGMVRVEVAEDKRRGFLGLAGWLTVTSMDYRTSPTLRGYNVATRLLCIEFPPPRPEVPIMSDEPPPNATDRQKYEWIVTHKECITCHTTTDPIGLGLDDYDGIGRYRTTDARGRVLDVSGRTPDGTPFNGGGELGPALAKDPQTLECAVRNFLVYATGRGFNEPKDYAFVARFAGEWKANPRFENLFEPVVMSTLFRTRRARGALP